MCAAFPACARSLWGAGALRRAVFSSSSFSYSVCCAVSGFASAIAGTLFACAGGPCALRPPSGSAPTPEVSRFHSLRPLAAACLSCAPGQSRPDELRALAASPVTADRGARYPSRCAPPVGAPSRSGGFVQWFVLPPSSPWSSSRPAQPAPVFQVWRRSPTATRSGLGLSAFGSTASMRPSRHRAAAPPARPGFDSAQFRIVRPCLRSGRVVHSFRPSHLSPPHPLSSPGTRYAARVTPCTVRALGPGTAEGDAK